MKAIISNIKTLKTMHLRDSLIKNDSVGQFFDENIATAISDASDNEYTVGGYLYKVGDQLLLLSDLRWIRLNGAMPDSVFIALNGNYFNKTAKEVDALIGRHIECNGFLNASTPIITSNGPSAAPPNIDISLSIVSPPKVGNIATGFIQREEVSLCELSPIFCKNGGAAVTKNNNYALLFSGGIDPTRAFDRFWMDLKGMYYTLIRTYGYTPDKIIVVYKNGRGKDKSMPVNYPATTTGLTRAIAYLSQKLSANTDLFLFITNHGGGYLAQDDPPDVVGNQVGQPITETNPGLVDQTVFYYNNFFEPGASGTDISGTEFADKINSLHFNRLIGVFEECFGGGLLHHLKGPNRVLLSAATEVQESHSDNSGQIDLFAHFLTMALNNTTYQGTIPDADHNGKVSLLEAFQFACQFDTATCETPLLEDDGDGNGTHVPPKLPGKDGFLSANVYLKANK
jgi:hypothetical protein